MIARLAPVAACAALLAAACAAPRVDWERQEPRSPRDGDVLFLVSELQRLHPDVYATHPPEVWEAEVAALRGELPHLDETGFLLGLMRIIALAGDSHTKLVAEGRARVAGPRFLDDPRYPIALRWFPDGCRVIAADDSARALIGSALQAVDGVPVAEVLTRVGTVVPHENGAVLRLFAPERMTQARVLHGLGVTERVAAAEFLLRVPGEAAPRAVTLAALPRRDLRWRTHRDADEERRPAVPHWRRHRGDPYWAERVGDGGVLYLRFARCRDDPARPFAEFFADLVAPIASGAPDAPHALVVDLRDNGGGNSRVLMPLVRWFEERGEDAPRLYGLMNAGSYSSGLLNAFHLRTLTDATLVGTAPAQPLDSFGEVRRFVLPASGIGVQHSTRLFALRGDGPERLLPDASVPLTGEDWLAGRDPVLAWVLERETKP